MSRLESCVKPCCRICAHWHITLGCQHTEAMYEIAADAHANRSGYTAAFRGSQLVGAKPRSGYRIYKYNPCKHFKAVQQ